MSVNGDEQDRPVLVLFRTDLRVADNLALTAAVESGRPVVTVFVFDELSPGVRLLGGARRWWLHRSVAALQQDIRHRGGELTLRRGAVLDVVDSLVKETNAAAVFWNRRYNPPELEVDKAMKASLRKCGIEAESFDGHLLHEPSRIKTKTGGYYKVYTPFWRALMSGPEPRDPVPAPKSLRPLARKLASDKLSDWKLLPTNPDWARGFADHWTPGEAGAHDRLTAFFKETLDGYGDSRDRPGVDGTSRLSPHLAQGEITPYQIFAALKSKTVRAPAADLERFRKEIVWREFSYHLLFHNPDLAKRNFNSDFNSFKWHSDSRLLAAWQRGDTGYPIVDAGLRQLWQTGWMHNRVRMIVASFLIKHLLTDWRDGEEWFWDTLVDADPANNPASWQWVAGSGADAAPYFRVFNPILQGEKFDPKGVYVRRYVPELAKLSDKFIHRPWQASKEQLSDAGMKLGEHYPVPVVDHDKARQRALDAYRATRGNE